MYKSKHVIDHKHLEDIYEESLQIPRQNNQFLCNRSDEPLKASGRQSNTVRTPRSVLQITMKTSGRQSNTV